MCISCSGNLYDYAKTISDYELQHTVKHYIRLILSPIALVGECSTDEYCADSIFYPLLILEKSKDKEIVKKIISESLKKII